MQSTAESEGSEVIAHPQESHGDALDEPVICQAVFQAVRGYQLPIAKDVISSDVSGLLLRLALDIPVRGRGVRQDVAMVMHRAGDGNIVTFSDGSKLRIVHASLKL